ncbi:MAG: hypothetical protein ACRCY3_10200, partial [Sphingorhabdus sp.]
DPTPAGEIAKDAILAVEGQELDPGLRRDDDTGEIVSQQSLEATAAEPAVTADDGEEILNQPAATQPTNLTHWRWIGLRKPKPQQQRPHFKAKGKPKGDLRPQPSTPKPQRKAEVAAPTALALQLAALKEKMGG